MKARITTLVLLACMGCGGDGNDEVIDGGGGSVRLTAQEILDLLVGVDGEGSGLDSDSVDGVEASELALAGARTHNVPTNAIAFSNTAVGTLDENGSNLGVFWRIPANGIAGQPVRFVLLTAINDLAQCQITLSPEAEVIASGNPAVDLSAAVVGGNIVTNPSGDIFEIAIEVSEENAGDLSPGNWIDFRLRRLVAGACPGVIILGLAIEHQIR